MQYWEHIIHTALLGTDKRTLNPNEFPQDLAPVVSQVEAGSADKETRFLNLAAVANQYRKCGSEPLNTVPVLSEAEEETRLYCSTAAHQVLGDIIYHDSPGLLQTWLHLCLKNNLVVAPEWLPQLFELGSRYKNLQRQLYAVGGNRGAWLERLNPAWRQAIIEEHEEPWLYGTTEQRKLFLKNLRLSDTATALKLLQDTWQQENANTRVELLSTLENNIGMNDVDWLQSLQAEKSQRVKDEALRLLRLCPNSDIVQLYQGVLKQSVTLKKESRFLGLDKRIILNIQLAEVPEEVFKSGIQKLPSKDDFNSDDFTLFQLIAAVPPSFFESHFALDKKEIIEAFRKSEHGSRFIEAFQRAAITFNDKAWLTELIGTPTKFDEGVLYMLSNSELEHYLLAFMDAAPDNRMLQGALNNYKGEWSLALTRSMLRFMANVPYLYNPAFVKQHINRFPVAIVPELDKIEPTQLYVGSAWMASRTLVKELLLLKQKISTAFPS